MKYKRTYHGNNISFIDMLFNIIIVFVLLFFMAILLMNPVSKEKDVEAKADLLIIMTWPDNNPHDIDLWVKPPNGSAIGFTHKTNSYLFLDRDDLGVSNNFVIINEKKVTISTRREVMTFRGKEPGRYVVNAHFFLSKGLDGKMATYDGVPVPVMIELVQINPVYKILVRKEVILTMVREEKTAFSFIIRDDNVTEIDIETEEHFILNHSSHVENDTMR